MTLFRATTENNLSLSLCRFVRSCLGVSYSSSFPCHIWQGHWKLLLKYICSVSILKVLMKVSEISDPSKTVLEISNMIKKKKKKDHWNTQIPISEGICFSLLSKVADNLYTCTTLQLTRLIFFLLNIGYLSHSDRVCVLRLTNCWGLWISRLFKHHTALR